MVAIVGDSETWTARAVEIATASEDPGVRYWLGPLYNNVGWSRYGIGDISGALEAFELALASRERDDPRPYPREIARYAVGKALRGLGRTEEAVAALEQCVAWAAEAGVEDGHFHEEARRGLCRARPLRRCPRAGPPRARNRLRRRRSFAARAPARTLRRDRYLLIRARASATRTDELPDYRITCIFVDRDYRRSGVAGVALRGALDLIANAGGGAVEGYPQSRPASATTGPRARITA